MANDGSTAAPDMSGGDAGSTDTGGGSPAPDSGSTQAQVIPKLRGDGGDDGGELEAANDNGQPRAAKPPKPTKHKVKFFGQEREISSIDDVLPLLSDDYEWEIPVSGEKRKYKIPDMIRGTQLSEGAFDRMRKASEIEKGWQEKIEHGKQDPMWGLQMMFDVQDPVMWAAQVIRQRMTEDEAIRKAYEAGDHFEHQRLVNERAKKELEQRNAFEASKKQREEQSQKQQQMRQMRAKGIHDAVVASGVPWTRAVAAHAAAIDEKWRALGHELTPDHVAAMAREEWLKETNGYLDSLDDDALVKFLGEERRKKLRAYELAALRKGGKQQPAQQQQPANTNGAGKRPEPSKGMTEKEFRDQWRR